MAKVHEDKAREAGDGFDGSWVPTPTSSPIAAKISTKVLGDRPNQLDRLRDDVSLGAADCWTSGRPGRRVTEAGLRNDVSVGLRTSSPGSRAPARGSST